MRWKRNAQHEHRLILNRLKIGIGPMQEANLRSKLETENPITQARSRSDRSIQVAATFEVNRNRLWHQIEIQLDPVAIEWPQMPECSSSMDKGRELQATHKSVSG